MSLWLLGKLSLRSQSAMPRSMRPGRILTANLQHDWSTQALMPKFNTQEAVHTVLSVVERAIQCM